MENFDFDTEKWALNNANTNRIFTNENLEIEKIKAF